MDLFIFIILLLIVMALTLVLNYYRRLFSDGRREYPRDEILSVQNFLLNEWQRLTSSDSAVSYTGLSAGIFMGFLFSYLGGMYGEHFESYFFHSAILPILLYFGLPYLNEKAVELEITGFARKLLQSDIHFLFGFSAATAAQLLSAYGMYHALSFLWVFFNFLICIGLVLYRLYKTEQDVSGLPDKRSGRSGTL